MMPGYHRNPEWGMESLAANGMLGLIVVGAIMVAAVLATIFIILTTEIARVYTSRALGHRSQASAPLWLGLAVFLAALLLAGFLATNPATLPAGMLIAAWSFLAFAVFVEGCEWWLARTDQPEEEPTVLDVLSEWRVDGAPVPTNGHTEPSVLARG